MADERLGGAFVEIEARLDKLEKGYRKAKQQTDTATKRMKRQWGSVTSTFTRMRGVFLGFAAAVGAVVGAGKLSQMTRSMLNLGTATTETAKKLGITTDFLQEAGFVAAQTGIDVRTLQMGMQRLTRRAAEAAKGFGEAKDTLAEMGIALETNEGQIRSTEDIFRDVMASLAGTESAALKLQRAFKLFDSEGAVLGNMARDFDRLSKRAHETGNVMDASVLKRAAELNNMLGELEGAMKVDMMEALAALAPGLVELSTGLRKAAGWAAKLMEEFTEIKGLADEGLNRRLSSTIIQGGQLLGKARTLAPRGVDTKSLMSRIAKGEDIDGGGGHRGRQFEQAVDALRANLDLQKKLTAEVMRRKELAEKTPPSAGGNDMGSNREQIAALEEQKDMIVEIRDEWLRSTNQEETAIRESTDRRIAALDRAILGDREYNKARVQLWALAEEEIRGLTVETGKEMDDLWDDFGDIAKDAFSRMLLDGKLSFRALGDAFVQEFLQFVIRRLIFDKVFAALSATLNIGAGAAGTPGKAMGGPIVGGQGYLVGERGPEMAVFPSGGRIIPSTARPEQLMRGAREGGMNVTINDNAGVDVEVEQASGPGEADRLVVQIEKRMVDRMANRSPLSQGVLGLTGQRRKGARRG